MHTLLARRWWSLVLRGLVAILFGLVTFAWPGVTLEALVLLFGAYALIDGILNLGAMFRPRAREHWWAFLLEGIAGVIAGIVTFLWPAITVLALVWIIAGWAFVTGIFEIVAA